MALTIDWAGSPNKIIDVPLADLTFDRIEPASGRSIYTFDLNQFHQDLRTKEAEENEGRPWPTTHVHNTQVLLGGVLYVRQLQLLSPYIVRHEDGQYGVEYLGANTNLQDRTFVNQVQIQPSNSAGLIVVETGVSGLTAAESTALTILGQLSEADEFFDKSTGLLHYYLRGTTTDIIPAKNITGETATGDVSALE